MQINSATPQTTAPPDWQPRTVLRGPWLVAARATWFALVILLGLYNFLRLFFFFSTQLFFLQPLDPVVRQLGFSYDIMFAFFIVLDIAKTLIVFTMAIVLFWRKSDDWMVIFVSLLFVTYGSLGPFVEALRYLQGPGQYIIQKVLLALGLGSVLLFQYIFPDGRFVPRWTRWLALGWFALLLSSALFPIQPLDFLRWSWPQIALTIACMYATGLLSQAYRYRRVLEPTQRQQTRWILLALLLNLGTFVVDALVLTIFPNLMQPSLASLIYFVIRYPLFGILPRLLVMILITVAILRYRLWAIDLIINRVLVYGGLTSALALVYLACVLLLQGLFRSITGQERPLAVVLSTLAIAALFQPWRDRLQAFIDRSFYRERVSFRQAFSAFSREVRTMINLDDLLRVLVTRVTDMLHTVHGAVFLRRPDGAFTLAEFRRLVPTAVPLAPAMLPLTHEQFNRLAGGGVISRPGDSTFPLLVPLLAPVRGANELIGVLALGPHRSEQPFSRGDQELLLGLADQAGTAISVAQLIEQQHAEARRREEAERHLEAHRNSPIGRAEATARELIAQPDQALIALHQLAQSAGKDAENASLLDHLPRALGNLGAQPIAGLAQGFHYLVFSQYTPVLLPVGVRSLALQLEQLTADQQLPAVEEAGPAQVIYQLCQAALEADSIARIADLSSAFGDLQTAQAAPPPFLIDLGRALGQLRHVIEALRAYERVDTPEDRLAYLASAVERLSRVDRAARAELGSADRQIIQRIGENWLTITTSAMRELQTRAQITSRLLTRHTLQSEIVALSLNLCNVGRGTALNLQISVAPSSEYSLIDQGAHIVRLAPGEEAQVDLRVRFRAAQPEQFRARFIIAYADPRGPDQIEHFSDLVSLLPAEGAFMFIPNPYVVGTPLQPGSPLFFGREDVVAFIQDNLAAAHRNNLVLIGQRRTGKTSLLKQLPLRLGDTYLPVYLDGQTLGLDPGLPNFFLNIATEITFALEDCGFSIPPPDLADFVDSPTTAFERGFLAQLRSAIGQRHLLLLLDEFEELEASVRRGTLEDSVFGFLRHLIQHTPNLSVIFCGTHRLEELAADYWSVLFNISLYRHVGFLEQAEAQRLIREPVASYGMRYDDLAMEKIWRVTAGHPYFLQLLCHSLVNRHNKSQRSYMAVTDVNAALEEILASGQAHFVYLWTESTHAERLALTALSRMIPLTGQASAAEIVAYLAERGISADQQLLTVALDRLALRDILQHGGKSGPDADPAYRWKLGLLGLWAEKYRSLNRVVDEARQTTRPAIS